MGIALLIVVTIYLLAGAIVLYLVKRWTKSKAAVWLGVLLLIFGPFWRPILCNLLFKYYGKQPLQAIHQTVESPISVYWQDNVWPGFDKHFRESMVEKYLDGVHLQALAMNGDDGKIYLYRADKKDWLESNAAQSIWKQRAAEEAEFQKKDKGNYKQEYEEHCKNRPREECGEYTITKYSNPERAAFRGYLSHKEQDARRIMDRAEVFASPDKLPPMRYRVDFNLVKTGYPASRLLHTDEITITDVEKNEVIAFSRRYMGYGNWLSQFGGANPDFHQVLGDKQAYQFVDKVLFGSIDAYGSRQGRNNSLLDRLSKKYHENRR